MSEQTAPEVEQALEEFDVVDFLSDTINAESDITVYKDGTTLVQLARAEQIAREATEEQKQAEAAKLSIADEYDEAAAEATQIATALRDKLSQSGITFSLRSVGTESRDVLIKKLERESRFKAVPAKDGEPAVQGKRDHPDFQKAFEEELLALSIVKAAADGKVDPKKWTPARVRSLRKLPGNEFTRLWNKCYELHFMQYNIDRMIDLDFSSRP